MANNNFPYFNSKREYESPIHEFRVAAGLTCKELMKQSNVNLTSIFALANGMMSPIKENGSGELKESAKLLCQFFEVGPEVLFPRYICTIDRSFKHEVLPYETWSERVADGSIERLEKNRIIKRTVQTGLNILTEKERRILHSYYFNDESYRQIAIKEGVSVERIRQIVMKALRRLAIKMKRDGVINELEEIGAIKPPESKTESKTHAPRSKTPAFKRGEDINIELERVGAVKPPESKTRTPRRKPHTIKYGENVNIKLEEVGTVKPPKSKTKSKTRSPRRKTPAFKRGEDVNISKKQKISTDMPEPTQNANAPESTLDKDSERNPGTAASTLNILSRFFLRIIKKSP